MVMPLWREFAHHRQDFVDHFRVQRRSRLVEQQHLRIHGQRTRDRHPLLLAAGELYRVLGRLILQPDPFEQQHGLAFGSLAAHLADPHRRQRDIAQDAQVREQVETLEDHSDLAADRVEVLQIVVEDDAVDDDLARIMRFEAIQGAQEGRFAGSGRPDDRRHLSFVEGRRNVLQRVEGAETLVDLARLDDRSKGAVGLLM
jgi:hypothetical protein